jgi:hypothetical protein
VKLPIPQELLDQLGSTEEKMSQIVEGLGAIAGKLDELIAIEKARE